MCILITRKSRSLKMYKQAKQNKKDVMFPQGVENIDPKQLRVPIGDYINNVLNGSLPDYNMNEIHRLRQRQQSKIMEQIRNVKQTDILQDITHACHLAHNIRDLSEQEIARSINYYTQKLTQQRSMSNEVELDEQEFQNQDIKEQRILYMDNGYEFKDMLDEKDQQWPWSNDLMKPY